MADIAGSQALGIRPEGVLGVDRAAALKAELLEALAVSGKVVLNMEAVTDIDLACLQVLYSARKTALERSREFSVRGSLPQRSLERLHAAGFLAMKPGGGTASAPVNLEALLVDFQGEGPR